MSGSSSRATIGRRGTGLRDGVDYLDHHKGRPAMLMHNPPHPGAFIRRQCLEPLGLTVTEAAKGLAVSRNTFSWPRNPLTLFDDVRHSA